MSKPKRKIRYWVVPMSNIGLVWWEAKYHRWISIDVVSDKERTASISSSKDCMTAHAAFKCAEGLRLKGVSTEVVRLKFERCSITGEKSYFADQIWVFDAP